MYVEKSNSILFFVLKYPPNSIPKDLSGFKFGFGTTTFPGSESKTLARSSILGDLNAVETDALTFTISLKV